VFDIGNFILFTVILSVGVPIVITIVVVVAVIWTIRQVMPTGKRAAEMELRNRLARGEISPAEYQASLDVLQRND
jgi:uncharacterized membrane protein